MKNIYIKLGSIGAIIGIIVYVFVNIVAVPALSIFLYYITINILPIRGDGPLNFYWIFVMPLLNSVLIYALYGLGIALVIKAKDRIKDVLVMSLGVALVTLFFGLLNLGESLSLFQVAMNTLAGFMLMSFISSFIFVVIYPYLPKDARI